MCVNRRRGNKTKFVEEKEAVEIERRDERTTSPGLPAQNIAREREREREEGREGMERAKGSTKREGIRDMITLFSFIFL